MRGHKIGYVIIGVITFIKSVQFEGGEMLNTSYNEHIENKHTRVSINMLRDTKPTLKLSFPNISVILPDQ